MKNVTFKFKFSGTDKHGEAVSFYAKTTEKTYAKCFTSAARKFFTAFPGGKIIQRDPGVKVTN